MSASQDPLRDNAKVRSRADHAVPRLAHLDRRREAIEEQLSSGSPEAAARSVSAYWRAERSPAAAHFVVRVFETLRPQIQLVDCRLAIQCYCREVGERARGGIR